MLNKDDESVPILQQDYESIALLLSQLADVRTRIEDLSKLKRHEVRVHAMQDELLTKIEHELLVQNLVELDIFPEAYTANSDGEKGVAASGFGSSAIVVGSQKICFRYH